MKNYIDVHTISKQLPGQNVAQISKWAPRRNLEYITVPHPPKLGAKIMSFPQDVADSILSDRKFLTASNKNTEPKNSLDGFFYFVQLFPDIFPNRCKLGFTSSLKRRLEQHRTTCPTLKLLAHWNCQQTWEKAAIRAVGRTGSFLSKEVIDFPDLELAKLQGDAFFKLLS